MTNDWMIGAVRVIGMVAFLFAAQVSAEEAGGGGAKACRGPSYSLIDVLDPNLPAERKRVELDKVRQRADDPNCGEARYLLGHLLRHGESLPGNLIARDTARARLLIEEFALRGNAWAFADLAELAIEEEQGLEAIKWVQVYLYLVARTDEKQSDMAHTGYNGDLLLRAQEVARKARVRNRSEAARTELNAYLAAHRAELLGNRRRVTGENAKVHSELTGTGTDDGLRVRKRNASPYVDFGRLKPGYAVYLMEVQPDGRVSRIVPSSFGPTPEHAKRLRQMLEGWEFHPHPGQRAMVLRVPVEYGYTNGPRLKVPPKS